MRDSAMSTSCRVSQASPSLSAQCGEQVPVVAAPRALGGHPETRGKCRRYLRHGLAGRGGVGDGAGCTGGGSPVGEGEGAGPDEGPPPGWPGGGDVSGGDAAAYPRRSGGGCLPPAGAAIAAHSRTAAAVTASGKARFPRGLDMAQRNVGTGQTNVHTTTFQAGCQLENRRQERRASTSGEVAGSVAANAVAVALQAEQGSAHREALRVVAGLAAHPEGGPSLLVSAAGTRP